MATQTDIARAVGVDVSSVNKILNRKIGPVFKKETIQLVFETAKLMQYPLVRPNKEFFVDVVAEIFTSEPDDFELSVNIDLPLKRVKEIRSMLKRVRHRSRQFKMVKSIKVRS